jgi:hypothetical protein
MIMPRFWGSWKPLRPRIIFSTVNPPPLCADNTTRNCFGAAFHAPMSASRSNASRM